MMPSEATVQLSRSDYCHLTGTNCTEYPVTQLTETHAAGLCVSVCACRRHSASPECWEVRDYDSSDSVDLVGWGWGWHMLTLRKRMENTDTEELNKYKRLTDLLICPFFFFYCGFVYHFLLFSCLNVTLSLCPRDDNFSDTLSQKADSEASSGHAGEDKCSGKDIGSPNDTRISEAFITRWVYCCKTVLAVDAFLFVWFFYTISVKYLN